MRLALAIAVAPLAPLAAFYLLSLAMDGPAPVVAAEPARVAFLAVPALLLAYPWGWLIGTPPLLWLRRRPVRSWLAFAAAGLAAGAVPAAIGAARSDALSVVAAVLVFGAFGAIFGLAFRTLAGAPRQGRR